jgi:hypothetical protein
MLFFIKYEALFRIRIDIEYKKEQKRKTLKENN